ncbi:hypothetical protein [Rhodohalobacter mucosus]|nr:hypothetical protein [Rhodohalobacter mucosus]
MKKITAILLIVSGIVLYGSSVHAQTTDVTQEEIQEMMENRSLIVVQQETETIGSPYLYEGFRTGRVTLHNGRQTEELSMNFNIYENRVEYADNSTILAIPSEGIQQFTFTSNGESLTFKKGFSASGLDPDEFVLVLSEGDVTALYKYEKNFQEAVATYGTAVQRDEYIDNTRFYTHSNGETDRMRRVNERNLIRALNSHQDEMRSFFESQNLNPDSPQDLRRFFNHYNQLAG